MTENSVKNLASMFNQPNPGPGVGRPTVASKPGVAARPGVAAKPGVASKPSMMAKPGKLDLDNNMKIIGATLKHSPRFEKPSNGTVKSPSKDLPKKVTTPAKIPMVGPVLPGANTADILNMKGMLKKAPGPSLLQSSATTEAGQVDFRRSLKKAPVAPPLRTTPSIIQRAAAAATVGSTPLAKVDEVDAVTKENTSTSKSEGDSSSLSSFASDSSIPRRGSETSQKAAGESRKPMLEPLPPLETIGPPPKKPAKPKNVKLPKLAAPLPSAKSHPPSLKAAQEAEPIGEDSGEIYDDVAVDNAAAKKRISLIPTMDSDEEESVEDLLYDDTDVKPAEPLPPLPPVQSIPAVPQISVPTDDGPQEIYDDVSLDGESEELYEALDVSMEDTQAQKRPSLVSNDSADGAAKPQAPSSSSLASLPSPRKTVVANSRQEEKQRREQEKIEQQRRKKEEEMRKKRDKEEKKRREKEEKDMKKKFNIKGDVQVLDTGMATQDCGSDYEKSDLICKQGDRLHILRREGNPPGKWLARNSDGKYGFVDADFVAITDDCQETYDDVIPCEESGSEEEEQQEIYEAFD